MTAHGKQSSELGVAGREAYIRDRLSYNNETGFFAWRTTGKRAGSMDAKGYIVIEMGRRRYKAHRLAWWFETGYWPDWPHEQIDHVNGRKSDNRFNNLRLATNSKNKCNSPLRADNKSGYKCVQWREDMQKWIVVVKMGNTTKYCGAFPNVIDAAVCANYNLAFTHGEFAQLNRILPEGWTHGP